MDGLATTPSDLIFFTGTLPGSTPAAMLALSQWSGFIVHRLKAWIASRVDNPHLIYCWEWQKRGALHLHLSLWVENPEERREVYAGLRAAWIRLLLSVSDKSGCDLFARAGGRGTWRRCLDKVRARAEWVKKSVAAYLGKYMGKSCSPGDAPGRFFYPSRWWGSTMNLKRLEVAARSEAVFYFASERGALNFAEEINSLVLPSAEWHANYKTKVVRGIVYLLEGVSIPFLTAVIGLKQPKRRIMREKTVNDAYKELSLTLLAVAEQRPTWFKCFVSSYPQVSVLMDRARGKKRSDLDPNRLLIITYSVASALEQACRLHPVFNGQWLGEQLTKSSMESAISMQRVLMKRWDKEYMHVLEDAGFREVESDLL